MERPGNIRHGGIYDDAFNYRWSNGCSLYLRGGRALLLVQALSDVRGRGVAGVAGERSASHLREEGEGQDIIGKVGARSSIKGQEKTSPAFLFHKPIGKLTIFVYGITYF
jgi:hypothetical protein